MNSRRHPPKDPFQSFLLKKLESVAPSLAQRKLADPPRSLRVAVYSIDGITPVVHRSAYVHPSAILIGDVIIAAGV
jgi:hypothetical protein